MLRPLSGLFKSADYPDLLVGLDAPDDAAVWRLEGNRALVATLDFFTPVVDDPYDYGAIAAANSLSDVYAMGGNPFLALNVAALPPALPEDMLAEIVRGGAEKALEAGVVVAGGHTVQDQEPKYGLVVLGFVDRRHSLTKGGVRAGDMLVLTKPLGFGVTTTALKQEKASPEDIQEVIGWMKRLNRDASHLATGAGLRGATDITGYSLLGHAYEMASASNVRLRFFSGKIPLVSGARRYGEEWLFPGGASDNRLFYEKYVSFAPAVDEVTRMLLFDPQTSGGLLLAVPHMILECLLARAGELNQPLWVVGEALEEQGEDGMLPIEVV